MSNKYVTFVENCFNDLKRDIIEEIRTKMEERNLTNVKIQELLDEILVNVKQNKKVVLEKKIKKGRVSGYHIFLKEERVRIKSQEPDIRPQELTSRAAKGWAALDSSVKEEYNEKARVLKEKKAEEEGSSSGSDAEPRVEPQQDEKDVKKKTSTKKPRAKASEPKQKPSKTSTKKVVSPPPPPVENEESNDEVEDADSDIDL